MSETGPVKMTCMKNLHHLLTSSEIQLLMVVVMAGPLLAQTTNSSSPGPHLKEASFDRLPLNDVLFTEDVLLEVSARSRIECSKKCVETEGCVMCTFLSSPQGPPGHCRLHSQLQNAADVKESKPGARSVARKVSCDGPYELACGRCLNAVASWVSYNTATQGCSQMQGKLIVTKSLEELDCVRFFAKDRGLATSWVGADDKVEAGVFRWNDGSLLPDNSSLWKVGRPRKDNPGQDCVGLFTNSPGLLDGQCGMSSPAPQYVCQKGAM